MNMKWISSRIFWGVLLIVGGILFFLQNFGILPGGGGLFWAVVFAVFGLFVLSAYAANRENWWALIPGIILLDLALMNVLETFTNIGQFSGALFLGGIGVSFFAVYFASRAQWWAIIPGGVLLTLAAVSGIEDISGHALETGGIFFLGLGLTFILVALLPTPAGRMRWAYIPAAALLVMGLLLVGLGGQYVNIVFPALLILVGIYLVYRAFGPKQLT